jgi:hypothetical protein
VIYVIGNEALRSAACLAGRPEQVRDEGIFLVWQKVQKTIILPTHAGASSSQQLGLKSSILP